MATAFAIVVGMVVLRDGGRAISRLPPRFPVSERIAQERGTVVYLASRMSLALYEQCTTMPQELLAFPPLYVIVGIYRLATDPVLRDASWDKVRHATYRGVAVGVLWTIFSWPWQHWFVKHFLVGSRGWWGRKPPAQTVDGLHVIGNGAFAMDIVLYTHIVVLLPQLTQILRFFLMKNIRLSRSRAWALTVASRGKGPEFWSNGYVEEWASPPVDPSPGTSWARKNAKRNKFETIVKWLLWWPSQMLIRHFILMPISPTLPFFSIAFTAALRAIATGRYLHEPYFAAKKMSDEETWRFVEERRWGYRAFGFTASLVEQIPIIGLAFSVSNRVGAAMWAFDLEKRQHAFAAGELEPLRPDETGLLGGTRYQVARVEEGAADAKDEMKKDL